MIQRISEWLALTKTEQNIILFLSVTLLLGIGLKLFRTVGQQPEQYDYSVSDSIFAARSMVPEDSVKLASPKVRKEELHHGININTATQEQLESLPGIGATLARRIIEYRESVGRFRTIDELQQVKGISKKKLETIKPYISIQ